MIAYQFGAYQAYAYQTLTGNRAADNNLLGGKDYPSRFSYVTPYSKYREAQYQEKIKRQKTELQKLDSVLEETQRKKELVAKNRAEAKKKAAIRLLELENQYLEEINRLLMVRAELIRRIREDEAILIIMMMKRRRLRVA